MCFAYAERVVKAPIKARMRMSAFVVVTLIDYVL